jgi:hypothetical protein
MTTDSEVRLCQLCSCEIPKWKAKGARFCSPGCKFKFEKQKKEKRNPRLSTGSVLHQCLSNPLDAKVPCRCRKRISDEDAKRLVREGHVVDYKTRISMFTEGQPLLIVGKHLRFPRSATIERPMIERSVADIFTIKGKARIKQRSIEEMRKTVAQDKLDRAEEESLRMNIYGWLTAEAWRALVVEVPAEEYDRAERDARGRCLFNFADERSSAGIDIAAQFSRWDAETEESTEDKIEIETEEVEEEEPEREDGLTVLTADELQEVEI